MTSTEISIHINIMVKTKLKFVYSILSGYDNELYNTELSGWCTAERETTAQMGLHRTEKLWMNFESASQLKLKL